MSIFCDACGAEILDNGESLCIDIGTNRVSKKSGRNYHEPGTAIELHPELSCVLTWLSRQARSDYGALQESIKDAVRPILEKDIRIEAEDELFEELRDQAREEMMDELGRTCATCGEELEEVQAAMDRDVPQQSTIPIPSNPGWLQPLKTS